MPCCPYENNNYNVEYTSVLADILAFKPINFISLAMRCGYNYAKKVNKLHPMFVDECQAEALYWLVVLFDENYWEIMWQSNQERYIRMKLSYKLKEYWSSRDSLSQSFYTQSGKHIETNMNSSRVASDYSSYSDDDYRGGLENYLDQEKFVTALALVEIDILDSVLRDERDAEILSMYCDGLSYEEIGDKVKHSEHFVRKTLLRIEKGIKSCSHL